MNIKHYICLGACILMCVLLLVVSVLNIAHANGGDQRVGDGYLINLARSPFTPITGVRTAMTASFVNLATGNLIKDDILVHLWITDGRGSKNIIHEERAIPVTGGILDFSYTFEKSGIHELYLEFVRANDPTSTVHSLPDFLIDVQPQMSKQPVDFLSLLLGIAIGYLLTVLILRFKKS